MYVECHAVRFLLLRCRCYILAGLKKLCSLSRAWPVSLRWHMAWWSGGA